MAFKAIVKIDEKHDCGDFKPYFFNRKFCKHSFECANAGNEYIMRRHYDARGLFDCRCIGMKVEKLKSPIGIKSGL